MTQIARLCNSDAKAAKNRVSLIRICEYTDPDHFVVFLVNACEELKIIVDEQAEAGNIDVQKILSEVRQLQLQLNVTPEYKMYMAMCAIFGPHRNIVKHWDSFEALFSTLVEQDGEGGQKHLLQTLVQFFVNRYPDQQKFAAALCTKLYNNSIIED